MTRQFKMIACTIAIAAGTLLINAASVQAQVRPNANLLRGNSLSKSTPRPVNVRAPIVSNNNAFNPNLGQNYNMNQGYNTYPYATYPSPYQNIYPGINSGYTPYGMNPYGVSPYGANPYQTNPYGFNPYGYFPGY
jgi:hypothetical protein